MQIKYIFLFKNEIHNKLPSKAFFTEIFDNVTESSFDVKVSKSNFISISYNEAFDEDNQSYYLTLSYDGTRKEFTAKALSKAHSDLVKGDHRRHYHIVTILDEVSQYYAAKGYPWISRFECKLRELAYHVLIKAYGTNWKHETTDAHKGKVNRENLDKLTLSELEKFLFEKYMKLDIVKDWDSLLSSEQLKDRTKEEIVEILALHSPKSLWERLFDKEIKINDLQEAILKIQNYRHAIAHHREYQFNYYIATKKLLSSVIGDLEDRIGSIEKKIFTREERETISKRFTDMVGRSSLKVTSPLIEFAGALGIKESLCSSILAFDKSFGVKVASQLAARKEFPVKSDFLIAIEKSITYPPIILKNLEDIMQELFNSPNPDNFPDQSANNDEDEN